MFLINIDPKAGWLSAATVVSFGSTIIWNRFSLHKRNGA